LEPSTETDQRLIAFL